MTRYQLLVSTPNVCRLLILASSIWIFVLMIFYLNWNPQVFDSTIEKFEAHDDNFNDVGKVTKEKHDKKQKLIRDRVKVDYEKARNKSKIISKEFVYKKLVTPVPPEILKELGLKNPGENGHPVVLGNVSEEIEERVKQGWKRHEFNEFVSDLVSVHRTLPDARDDYCRQSNLYLKRLPATSVIIIFHNEAWSTLLRSVHSVLDQSPEHLIKEIILVDDYSNMPHLKRALEAYMANYPKVRILRADKREGLIKARIRGAIAAKGEILTFLDSHIECTVGWLEPLLDRIARDSTTVVCPVIDVIEDNTLEFSYQAASGLQVGGFDWFLIFDWTQVPQTEKDRKKDPAEPTRSPTMAGGLFSINKAFFEKLGMYDPDFDIWGGENLELSFKTWMCGGTLEIIPCSHVGHIFRKKSPYKWRPGVDVLRKNLVRLAEVWTDDYSKFYYLRTGFNKGDFGDISSRVKLRNDLNCKSFKWYLENVYTNVKIPDNLAEGYVVNRALSNHSCLDADVRESDQTGSLTIYSCHFTGGNQFFEFTRNHDIRKGDHCIDFSYGVSNSLQLYRCHDSRGNQEWSLNLSTNQLIHEISKSCLSVDINTKSLKMEACNETFLNQKWDFQYLYKEKIVV